MRLINANALINDIEELITEHKEMMRDSEEHPENYPENYETRALNLIAGLIAAKVEVDYAPTIDAEPVVRCKDCRFWENEHLCLVMSRYGSIDTKAEHYCSWGEKREA